MNTEEQQHVVDLVCSNNTNKIIAVNAIAGSGKTHTCSSVITTFKPKKGFYTAFNKAIVEDSREKFGKMLSCKTIHSLAYKYANPNNKRIQELSYKDITLGETIRDKINIINAINQFCLSKYEYVEDFFKENTVGCQLEELLYYMNKMLNEEMNPTFSYLLKKFHLLLLDKVIHPHYDLFIVDECQDISEVMLEILKLIDADKKLILGDKYQNIYTFMNTVNAFEKLESETVQEVKLTNSFRCIPSIGSKIELYGKEALESDYSFKGVLKAPRDEARGTRVYLSRSNAKLIEQMYFELQRENTFSLIRDVDSIFEFPIAMYNASKGHQVYSRQYKYLEDINSETGYTGRQYFEHIIEHEHHYDDQTVYMAKLMNRFTKCQINIYDLKEKVKKIKPNPLYVLSTIHAFKGLEADTVYLSHDIAESYMKSLEKATTEIEKANNTREELGLEYLKETPENLRKYAETKDIEIFNLYYVGLSRARYELKGSIYEA